jgi:hypothetical protein
MKHDSNEVEGQTNELVGYGRRLFETFGDIGWSSNKRVTMDSLEDGLRVCAAQACRTSISLLNNRCRLGNGYWLIPSEHAWTFCGLAPQRLSGIESTLKYALLTNVKPVLVTPPLAYRNSVEDDVVRTSIENLFEFEGDDIRAATSQQIRESWLAKRNRRGDPEVGYLLKVLDWLEKIENLVLDGIILLSPSTPIHETNRTPYPFALVNYDEFQTDSLRLGDFFMPSDDLRQLAPKIPDWLTEGTITPWFNIPPRLVGACVEILANVYERIPSNLEEIEERYDLSERERRRLRDPNYGATYLVLGWLERLGTDLLRSVSESVMVGASPFISGRLDPQYLSRLFSCDPRDSQLLGTPIDIGVIEIPGIERLTIEEAAELKARYPTSCARLGIAIEQAREEILSIKDPVERKSRMHQLQNKLIKDPLLEVSARIESAKAHFVRNVALRSAGAMAGSGGFTIAAFTAQPSLEVMSGIIASLAIGALGTSAVDYFKTKESSEILPAYVVYEVGLRNNR